MKLPKGRVPDPNNKSAWDAYLTKVTALNPGVTKQAVAKFVAARSKSVKEKLAVAGGTAVGALTVEPTPIKKETQEERLARISTRFDILLNLTRGCVNGKHRAAIVSGAGGVGKTYNIKRVLENTKESKGLKYTVKSGVVSPVHLYRLLWEYRGKNEVVVLDDMDNIFWDSDGLSILKAALDSDPVREISWMTNSPMLEKEGIPTTFLYEGTMIFITNIDFQRVIDTTNSKLTPHLQALMTRAHYLDLCLHEPQDLFAWIRYIVTKHGVLVAEGLTKTQEKEVLTFMEEHVDRMRSLSIRTAKKIGEHVLMNPNNWKPTVETTELRPAMEYSLAE